MKKVLFCFLFSLLFLFRSVDASVLLMIEAEGVVDGFVGENIASKTVLLSLSDEDYYFEIDDYEEISDWFDNMPEGLEAYVARHDDQHILVSFEGIPLETSEELISVNVPDGYIIDSNSEDSIGDLHNTPDEKARYEIKIREPYAEYERPSIVSGTVGEALSPQKVYVQLYHTTSEASMMDHEFPSYNGLLPKVVGIRPDNVIVIEYTGVPEKEDDSLIHTVLLNEDLKCDRDLTVTDREDVRFDIGKKDVPVIIPPAVKQSHEIPVTGIE